MLTAAIASRAGTAGPNADSAYAYSGPDGTLGAALVDGIGHHPGLVELVPALATVAARVAARRGPLAGLLTAAQLVEGDGDDAVAVVAEVPVPGAGPARVAWVGDCRAWWWCTATGELRQMTTDQTMGEQLRASGGVPVDLARTHDHWVRVSLATAVVATVREVWIPDHGALMGVGDLVVLTSDGVHDQVPDGVLPALVREHQHDPQALADALVAAASDDDGYRDDATAVVLAGFGEASC